MSAREAVLDETMRFIPGYEGKYLATLDGRVVSLVRGRPLFLRPTKNAHGYECIQPFEGSGIKPKTQAVHRLILLTFRGPAPEGYQGCHNDGNKLNNSLSNLRWDTPSANQLDNVRHGGHSEANQTACKRGHAFDAANTYVIPRGGRRQCRECSRQRGITYRAKVRAA